MHEGAPVGGDGRVGDHDGLQVEAPVSYKHNRIRLLLQHWRRAPKHLPCTIKIRELSLLDKKTVHIQAQ